MSDPWTAESLDDVLERIDQQAVEHVHAGLFDQEGVFREKRLPKAAAVEALTAGWSFIDALPWWGPNDATRADRAYRSERCEFDCRSLRPYPFEDHSALIVADYAGDSAELSPRRALLRQAARARELGLEIVGATEYEFIVLDQPLSELDAGGYRTLREFGPANRCWSGLLAASEAPLIGAYASLLERAAIPLHHLCSELGPGCLEAALPAVPVVRAADDAALFKHYTKAFFIERQQTVSFMAQLSRHHPGLGGHPIVSLRSTADGAALVADPARPTGLTLQAEHFIAGILALIPEMTVMFAPNVNSFRRYAPGNWAPRSATWGRGNYTCGIRVVTEPVESARIEFRLPGADLNPFTAFAFLVGAGLHGIEQKLALPPETTTIGRTEHHPAIGPLPHDLFEAALRFRDSAAAREIHGDTFVDHLAATCLHEAETMQLHVSAYERQRYLVHV